jgi:predicted AlkP superfamily pyrophosphatase or phosphodiesterase
MRIVSWLVLGSALLGCGTCPPGDPVSVDEPLTEASTAVPDERFAVVYSIDALLPAVYLDPDAHGLEVPTLRRLAREGAHSPGVLSVLPSLTYPSHASIATGRRPAGHGITANESWDPLLENDHGWYWYAEDIRGPTLWRAAEAAGMRTALIFWPTTVGAEVDALMPEIWRADTGDDVKLLRALSTPSLVESAADRHPDLWERLTPPDREESPAVDVAVQLIDEARPNLLMLHTWWVDKQQHHHGIWSDEANAAIEAADGYVARLLDALDRSGIAKRTLVVVASDHGFAPAPKRVRAGVLLAEAGLVDLDAEGKVTSYRAVIEPCGGIAFIHLAEDADDDLRRRVREQFQTEVDRDGSGIGRILSADEIALLGGNPHAFIALEAAPGFAFAHGYSGEPVFDSEKSIATHGYDPRREDMKASLILHGPMVEPGVLEGARLIDIAPTVAAWLGLDLPYAEGQPLI